MAMKTTEEKLEQARIFKQAHTNAKAILATVGNYAIAFSYCLKNVYATKRAEALRQIAEEEKKALRSSFNKAQVIREAMSIARTRIEEKGLKIWNVKKGDNLEMSRAYLTAKQAGELFDYDSKIEGEEDETTLGEWIQYTMKRTDKIYFDMLTNKIVSSRAVKKYIDETIIRMHMRAM